MSAEPLRMGAEIVSVVIDVNDSRLLFCADVDSAMAVMASRSMLVLFMIDPVLITDGSCLCGEDTKKNDV
jgi:hypothetical protein